MLERHDSGKVRNSPQVEEARAPSLALFMVRHASTVIPACGAAARLQPAPSLRNARYPTVFFISIATITPTPPGTAIARLSC